MHGLPAEQRLGSISGQKSPDSGILSESSDEGVTYSGFPKKAGRLTAALLEQL